MFLEEVAHQALFVYFKPLNKPVSGKFRIKVAYFSRTGAPQPDNYEGIKEGPIEADNNIGKLEIYK